MLRPLPQQVVGANVYLLDRAGVDQSPEPGECFDTVIDDGLAINSCLFFMFFLFFVDEC